MVKKDVVASGWEVLGQKTMAKVTRSFVQNGERRTEEEWPVGKPGEVKLAVAPKYAGEVTELEWLKTNTDLRRVVHENSTHGVTKRDETRTLQTYDYGDGAPVKTRTNPDGDVFSSPEDEAEFGGSGGPLDKTDVVKNMLDKHIDTDNASESENRKDHRAIWFWTVVGVVLAAVAIALVIAVR